MAIIPWDPFQEVGKFFDQEDFLPLLPTRWLKFPLTDVYKEGDDLVVKLEIPEIDPKKVEISIEDNLLKIQGKMKEEKKKERDYYQKEIRRTDFHKEISLPTEVQAKKAKASYQNGGFNSKNP